MQYEVLQDRLSKLLNKEPMTNKQASYNDAVLACKSIISTYKNRPSLNTSEIKCDIIFKKRYKNESYVQGIDDVLTEIDKGE